MCEACAMLNSQSYTLSCLHWSSSWTSLIRRGEIFSTGMWNEAMWSLAELRRSEISASSLIFSAPLGGWRGMLKIWRSRYVMMISPCNTTEKTHLHCPTVWDFTSSFNWDFFVFSFSGSVSNQRCPINRKSWWSFVLFPDWRFD